MTFAFSLGIALFGGTSDSGIKPLSRQELPCGSPVSQRIAISLLRNRDCGLGGVGGLDFLFFVYFDRSLQPNACVRGAVTPGAWPDRVQETRPSESFVSHSRGGGKGAFQVLRGGFPVTSIGASIAGEQFDPRILGLRIRRVQCGLNQFRVPIPGEHAVGVLGLEGDQGDPAPELFRISEEPPEVGAI